MKNLPYSDQLNREIDRSCQAALFEDLGGQNGSDITAELVPTSKQAKAHLITRENGIFCGQAWLEKVFELLGDDVSVKWQVSDGDKIVAGDTLCDLHGPARQLLTGERTAMNFIQTLSATATQTANYVSLIQGTQCKLLDTRKTIPGMRFGQKYAVLCGGGHNHRIGLFDAYLIKENHIFSCGDIASALAAAKKNHPNKSIEIEVETIGELEQALDGGADIVMLDNFSNDALKEAVLIRNQHSNQAKLEASGNVSEKTIHQIAQTGVDIISVGALTKHIQALDLSMRIKID